MKKIGQYILIAIALTFIIWGLVPGKAVQPVEAQVAEGEEFPILSVKGTGVVSAEPDSARVVFSVVTQAKTAKEAQQENSKIMTMVMDSLKENGISEENISTKNFKLYPEYDYFYDEKERQKERKLKGYQVSHELLVEMNEISKVGSIIDICIAAGVNRVNYVDFYLENDKNLRQEALRKAVTEAREKAQVMAEALDKTIAGIVSVREGGVSYPGPVRRYYDYEAKAEVAGGPLVETSISPGEIKILADVQIDFKLNQ
ncbi:MAG: uncharacterized protein PWQ96_210 [Clostridia bacterium]|jgi:hypothetical protein|nr:bp26: periplasmic immunogenic protein [Clostridiales bacterium]MDK2984568.1 uncharacterized protein [Clostridia bacterium]